MNDADLDLRVADALFDAAASTPENPDALNQILRRSTSPRGHRPLASQRLVVAGGSAVVVGAGLVAMVTLRADSSPPPHASVPAAAAGNPVAEPVARPASSTPSSVTLPVASVEVSSDTQPAPSPAVSGDSYIDDDAFLLANLYSMLAVGTATEHDSAMSFNVPEAEVAACMEQAGWQYQPEEEAPVQHGLSDEEFAAVYGFGIVASLTGDLQGSTPANSEYLSTLSEGQREAWRQSVDRCRGAEPGSDRWRFSDAWNVAYSPFVDVVYQDERIVAATDEWAQCMAAAGFPYASPTAMHESFLQRVETHMDPNGQFDSDEAARLGEEERATAVANVPCQAALDEAVRAVVADRFDEFKALVVAAWESGEAPDGQGLRQ